MDEGFHNPVVAAGSRSLPCNVVRAAMPPATAPIVLSALAVALWVVFPTPPAVANEELEGITITAPRDVQGSTTGEVVAEESAVASTHLPSQQLTEGGAGLARVLGRTAGVQSRGAGGFGSVETLTIRAGSSAQTGVYLDGIRLNGVANPTFDLGTIESLNLDSVDVYRGSTPHALGNSDIGGSVNLRTSRTLGYEPAGSISLNAGSFGAQGVRFGGSGGSDKWHALGFLSTRQSDNDYSVLNDNGTRFNTADDEQQRRNNADVTRTAALGRLLYRASDTREASVMFQAGKRESGIPTAQNFEDNEARFATDSASLHLTHTKDNIGNWNTRQTLYANRLDSLFEDPDADVGLGAQVTDSAATTSGARVFAEHIGLASSFSALLDWRHERLEHQDLIRGGRDLEAQRQEAALLSHYALWFLDDRLVLTPGVEWRQTRDRIRVSPEAVRLRGAPEAADESAFTQSLGLRAEFGRGFSVRANAARLQRSPSFTELFGDSGLLLASPDLQSERGTNVDLELNWQDTPADPQQQFSIGVFSSSRKQLIATVFDSLSRGRAENIPQADVLGMEVNVTSSMTSALTLSANLTWQHTEQKNPTVALDGNQLPGQAPLAVGTRLEWAKGTWRAWYGVDHERDRFYDTTNLLAAPNTTTHHAGVEWQRTPFSVSLAFDNLTDEVVEDFRRFPRPGRSAFLSVQLTL